MKHLKTTLAITFLVMFATTSKAGNVVDVNQDQNNTYMAAFSQDDLAQSFIQTEDNISGAGIFLQDGQGSSGSVTISLWSNLPNENGVMLASGSSIGYEGNWVDVFWSPIVTSSETMYLVFEGSDGMGIAGSTVNPYADGNVFANSGYGSFDNYDYTFRTYYDSAVSAVPEPSTYALMLGGLGLVGFMAARRRKKS